MNETVTLINTIIGGLALFGLSQVLVFCWNALKKYRYREVIKTYNSLLPYVMSGLYGYFLIHSSLVKSMVEHAKNNEWESVNFYLEDLILDIYASFIERYEDSDDKEVVKAFKLLKLKKWVDKDINRPYKPDSYSFMRKHEDPILEELKEIKRGISYFKQRDRSKDMDNMMKGLVTVAGDDEEE